MSSPRSLQWQASIGDSAQQQRHNFASGSATPGGPSREPAAIGAPAWVRKSVLLVDSNRQTRDSRAKTMRARGIRVDCVATAASARARLAAEKYNLILVDLGRDVTAAELLVGEIRTRNSRQLVGFLVGSPMFIAQSLGKHGPVSVPAAVQPSGDAGGPGDNFGRTTGKTETEQEKVA